MLLTFVIGQARSSLLRNEVLEVTVVAVVIRTASCLDGHHRVTNRHKVSEKRRDYSGGKSIRLMKRIPKRYQKMQMHLLVQVSQLSAFRQYSRRRS